MRLFPRKLVTCLLLAVYGGISLLGHGLHELAPGHGHHHGLAVVTCAVHSHGHGHGECSLGHHQHGSGHNDGTAAGPLTVQSGGCAEQSQLCDVCVFLAQMRSGQPQLLTGAVWQHLVSAVAVRVPLLSYQTALRLHAPRGPPALLG
jgi:hypothetical protein